MPFRSALVVLAALVTAAPLAAQTRFEWPDTAVDISKYETLEECRAAVKRARETFGANRFFDTQIWRDTTLLDRAEERRVTEPPIAATVKTCLGDFANPQQTPVDDYRYLAALYIMAGWPDRAHTIAVRRLNAVKDTARELNAVLDTLLDIFEGHAEAEAYNAFPPAAELVDSLVENWIPRVPKRLDRVQLYMTAMNAYSRNGAVDTIRVDRLAARVTAMMDSLDTRERRDVWEKAAILGEGEEQADRIAGMFVLNRHDFLDSLRSSTEEYVRAKRNAWTRATGQPPETYLFGMPLGEKAPPIEAEYWLGCKPDCGTRPVPGKINLLVTATRGSCAGVPEAPSHIRDSCARELIPLRRLIKRFPQVEFTVIAHTRGYYLYLKEGLTPEREAQLTREWLDWYGIDAPLAVTKTDFWRISEYDRRRVNRPNKNSENYSFGRSATRGGLSTMLIDQDGRIIQVRAMNRYSEEEYGKMIEILLEREKAAR